MNVGEERLKIPYVALQCKITLVKKTESHPAFLVPGANELPWNCFRGK